MEKVIEIWLKLDEQEEKPKFTYSKVSIVGFQCRGLTA